MSASTCGNCGRPLGDAMSSDDHACPPTVPDSTPTEREAGDVGEVAAVLAAHAWGDDTARIGHNAMQCACGWTAYETGSIYTLRERHDQHRAEVLAPLMAEREAAALNRGWGLGAKHMRAALAPESEERP